MNEQELKEALVRSWVKQLTNEIQLNELLSEQDFDIVFRFKTQKGTCVMEYGSLKDKEADRQKELRELFRNHEP